MFSEGQVQVMISVPAMRNKTAYCQTVLDELRRLIAISRASTPAVSEEWSIWPLVNPESCMRVYSYASPSLDGWLQDKPSMCNDCACIEVNVAYQLKLKKRFITAFARIYDSRPKEEIAFPELEIRISIPRSLWKQMNQDAFIEGVQEACCTLGATYAAIDQERLCPTGVADSLFMYFSADSDDDYHFTRYIPAVCWAQFLPISRISDYESVTSCDIPYCKLKPIHYGDQAYVWIQLSSDIWKPDIDARIAFRKHFSSSFPALDFHKLAEYPSAPQCQEEIYWMPLLEDEQKKLKLYK